MNKRNLMRLNIQHFAGEDDPIVPPIEEVEEVKSFNQDDVNEIVKKRLAKERVKFEEDLTTKLTNQKLEAERLAKLSESEREKEITQKAKAEFEEERNAFQLEKIELEVTKQLAEKRLPISFAKMLVTDNAETSLENIKKFETDWQDALSKAVDEKIKGTSPRGGSTTIGAKTIDIMQLAKDANIRK